MTSQDNQQYLTADMFNAKMDAFIRDNEKFRQEIHSEIRVLQDDVRTLKSDTSHIQTSIYWGFALMTMFIALASFLMTLAPSFLELIKNKNQSREIYPTIEQVQEIVDKAIARAFSSVNK